MAEGLFRHISKMFVFYRNITPDSWSFNVCCQQIEAGIFLQSLHKLPARGPSSHSANKYHSFSSLLSTGSASLAKRTLSYGWRMSFTWGWNLSPSNRNRSVPHDFIRWVIVSERRWEDQLQVKQGEDEQENRWNINVKIQTQRCYKEETEYSSDMLQ